MIGETFDLLAGLAKEQRQIEALTKREQLRRLRAGDLTVDTGLVSPQPQTDGLTAGQLANAGLATQAAVTQLSVQLGNAIAKLNDIFGAVDGLEVTAGNIEINSSAIGLNTDEVESLLRQVRDRLPSVVGQKARATGVGVSLSIEDVAALQSIVAAIQALPTPQTNALTDAQLRASPVPVNASLPAGQVVTLTPQKDALTDAQLRATAVPVTVGNQLTEVGLPASQVSALTPQKNALTDGELRAAPVPVNAGLPSAYPLPADQLAALTPQKTALTNSELRASPIPAQVSGTVATDDSSEREYGPGLIATLVTTAGDTIVFTPTAGKAWRLHWAYAVPLTRDSENAPVITIKTIASAAAGAGDLKKHYCVTAMSKRKVISMPADARLVVNLDIAGRVPVTFDIEEL